MKKISDNYLTAIKAAILGGEKIMQVYQSGDFKTEIKEDNSPVTLADKNSSDIIIKELTKTNIPILSEEVISPNYKERKKWSQLWIVDPLDGTKEFIKKTDLFCVNIGLIENKKPIFGVIYIPTKKTIYFGGQSFGSYKLNYYNQKINTSEIEKAIKLTSSDSKKEQIITGGKYYLDEKTKFVLKKNNITYNENDYIALPSAIKFCEIAEGNSDIYPRVYPCMEWDTASGHAIVQGVGKEIYDLNTNLPLLYNKEDLFSPFFIAK